jgi:competence protein ComEA
MKIVRNSLATLVLIALAFVAVTPSFAADAPAGTVNVNSASADQLALLPGVGPAVAARIVEHRTKNGAFAKTEDLMLVRGIGEKSFERMKPYVSISGQTTLTEAIRTPRAPKTAAEKKG